MMTLLADWLLQTAVRATLLLSGVYVLWSLLPATRPALRRRVLLLASAALLVLPFFPGWWQWSWPAAESGPAPPPPASDTGGAGLPALTLLCIWGWGAGCAVSLVRTLTGWRTLLRIVRTARPASLQAGLPGVPVLRSQEIHGPCVAGVLRPVLLLPDSAGAWTPEQWRMVSAHETQHLRQHDPRLGWLPRLVQGVYWWLPLAWWLRRSFQMECEVLCDRAALSGHSRHYAREYAGFLLSLQQSCPADRRLPATGMSDMDSPLGKRLERLLRGGPPAAGSRQTPGRSFLILLALGGLAGVAGVAFSLRTPDAFRPQSTDSALPDSVSATDPSVSPSHRETLNESGEVSLRLQADPFPAD